ncbi:AsmA family protein [Roseomonas sp. 18066]|uniref:AsmA family protein n=1 Tax=Roseomonas sp. 18066 TaxID=2681412 RepID=UPI0013574BF9|nr:AsmA family protein [Roseomonas sp. 18066]
MAPPRRRRGRAALITLAVVVAVPALAWGGLSLLLRDEVLRPRVIAAVEQATGRSLTLSGPIGIKLSLVPTVTLEGVALANAPGGSRADMLTARRVEAELALLPLLSRKLAFERLTLVQPDLLLELDAAGQGNWRFGPPRAPSPGPATSPAPGTTEPLALSVATIEIEGGRFTWRDARQNRAETLEIRRFVLQAPEPAGPITFGGRLGLRGVALMLEGQSGPLPRLLGASAAPEQWPLRLAMAAPGIQLVAEGAARLPESLGGWHFSVNATADRAERLAPFLGAGVLPPLTGLDVTAELSDPGPGAAPQVNRMNARVASADLSAWIPGLNLGASSLTIAGAGQPANLAAALTLRGLALQAEASLPGLPVLLADVAWPLRLVLRGQGIEAVLDGRLQGAGWRGASGELNASAADTAPLLQAFALPGPRLTEARLAARLGMAEDRISLDGLRLQSRQAVLEGEASLRQSGPRPLLTARLAAQRLDLDALLDAPAPVAAPAVPAPAGIPAVPALPPRPAAPAAAPAPEARRVIPALPLPLQSLRALDAELQLNAAELLAGGVPYRDVRGTAKLANGKLALDPFGLSLPGGRIGGRFGADASGELPRLSLAFRHDGPGLDLRPLLQGYGLPPQGSGRLEAEADLAGSGADLRAVAGSLTGHVSLAMANGQIDNRLLASLAGDLRRLLLPNAPTEGTTALRCLALRMVLRDGIARPQAMLVETNLADVVGSGEVNLKEERLALRLLPQIRLGGLGLSAPVQVGGSLAAPSYRLDPAGVPEAAAGIVGDLVARQAENQGGLLGQLAQQLAGRPAGSLPDCAQQLAVARGGRNGPVPPEQRRAPAGEPRVNPADLLRNLFGR